MSQTLPHYSGTVYLSGSISKDPGFKAKFDHWESWMLKQPRVKRCLNPTIFPAGWSYSEYMEHCLLMVRHADVIAMLPCWQSSPGAKAELAYAQSLGRQVIFLDEPTH